MTWPKENDIITKLMPTKNINTLNLKRVYM